MSQNVLSYSYRDQDATQDFDAHIVNKCSWRVTRFIFTIVLLVLVSGTSLGGATLTHYVLDKMEIASLSEWQNELLQVLLVGVPLGIVVGVLSFDFKAGLVVSVLTASSLFIAWETYLPGTGHMENGAFDFLFGHKLNNSSGYYFPRELAGISMWGLVLTFPTGYILYSLDFGPTYAISGSIIGFTFYISQRARVSLGTLSCEGEKCAYYMWGFLVWFVLLILSINRLCKTIRFVVKKSKQPIILRCYQWVCYSKIYVAVFEFFAFLFTLLLLASLSFYALVSDSRDRKGQTFFGLLVNILGLVITQSYRTGKCVQAWLHKRRSKAPARVRITPHSIRIARPAAMSDSNVRPPTYNQVLEAAPMLYPQITEANNNNNTIPNPNPNPPAATHQINPRVSEDEHNVEGFTDERTTLFREQQLEVKPMLHGCYICVNFFQKFFYIEILRIIQLLFDLIGVMFLGFLITLTVLAIWFGSTNSRYVDP